MQHSINVFFLDWTAKRPERAFRVVAYSISTVFASLWTSWITFLFMSYLSPRHQHFFRWLPVLSVLCARKGNLNICQFAYCVYPRLWGPPFGLTSFQPAVYCLELCGTAPAPAPASASAFTVSLYGHGREYGCEMLRHRSHLRSTLHEYGYE